MIKSYLKNITEISNRGDAREESYSINTYMRARDPIIHFYETFLSEYDPKTREMRVFIIPPNLLFHT